MRIAIGVASAMAPDRLGIESVRAPGGALMTRSFAVREVVIGAGGLLAAANPNAPPSNIRTWAGLGALTDIGDLAAAAASMRRDPTARVPALTAVDPTSVRRAAAAQARRSNRLAERDALLRAREAEGR